MQPPVFDKFENENRDFKAIGVMLWVYFGLSILLTMFLPPYASDGAVGMVTCLVTIGTIIYGKSKTKVSLDKSLYKINFSIKDLGKSFVLMTGISMVILFLISIVSSFIYVTFGVDLPQADISFDFSQVSSWIFLAYVCLLGPIFEELMFRGVILRTLSRYNRTFAIIASSIVFGLFHLYLEQGTHAFFIGVVLAYVSMKYNSMSLPIVLHIVHNSFSTLTSLNEEGMIFGMVFRILCMVLMFIWLSKNINSLIKEFKEDPIAYPFYSRLFIRFSFITWFVLFITETMLSFMVIV